MLLTGLNHGYSEGNVLPIQCHDNTVLVISVLGPKLHPGAGQQCFLQRHDIPPLPRLQVIFFFYTIYNQRLNATFDKIGFTPSNQRSVS